MLETNEKVKHLSKEIGGIEKNVRTFLVVQWLRIHLPMQGHGFDPWSGN